MTALTNMMLGIPRLKKNDAEPLQTLWDDRTKRAAFIEQLLTLSAFVRAACDSSESDAFDLYMRRLETFGFWERVEASQFRTAVLFRTDAQSLAGFLNTYVPSYDYLPDKDSIEAALDVQAGRNWASFQRASEAVDSAQAVEEQRTRSDETQATKPEWFPGTLLQTRFPLDDDHLQGTVFIADETNRPSGGGAGRLWPRYGLLSGDIETVSIGELVHNPGIVAYPRAPLPSPMHTSLYWNHHGSDDGPYILFANVLNRLDRLDRQITGFQMSQAGSAKKPAKTPKRPAVKKHQKL